METELQEAAERRLDEALAASGREDPRVPCRALLRELRELGGEAYEAALADYGARVVHPIASGEADPLRAWIAFGAGLAARLHPGRTVAIDLRGAARPWQESAPAEDLVLHLPDAPRERAIPLAVPAGPSPAQRAALDLLALGRVRRPDEAPSTAPNDPEDA